MNRRFCQLAVALLFSAAAAVKAAEPSSGFGYGMSRCANLSSILQHPEGEMRLFSWSAGYATAINGGTINAVNMYRDLSGLSLEGLVGAVTAYCVTHPADLIIAAVDDLLLRIDTIRWKPLRKDR